MNFGLFLTRPDLALMIQEDSRNRKKRYNDDIKMKNRHRFRISANGKEKDIIGDSFCVKDPAPSWKARRARKSMKLGIAHHPGLVISVAHHHTYNRFSFR